MWGYWYFNRCRWKASGSNTVVPFIEEHVSDNILELVIVTHADSDHLGGMVGLSNSYGALEVPGITYQYIVDLVMRDKRNYTRIILKLGIKNKGRY